ncbi:MAG: hypothetical protein ACYC5Y_12460 [Symbiobacteriia bacterium]
MILVLTVLVMLGGCNKAVPVVPAVAPVEDPAIQAAYAFREAVLSVEQTRST